MDEQGMALIPESFRTEENQTLFDAHENFDSLLGDMITKNSQVGTLSAELEDAKKGLEGKISIPGEEATEDEIAAFRKALGVPESAEGYELGDVSKIQGGAELLEAFKLAGLTKKQAETQLKAFTKVEAAQKAAQKAETEKALSEYKASLGENSDKIFSAAKDGVDAFFKDDEGKELIAGMVMDNPALIKAFSKIGQLVKEKPGIMSFGTGGSRTTDIYSSMKGLDD